MLLVQLRPGWAGQQPAQPLAAAAGELRRRAESWDVAITSDFVHAHAYQAYDQDAEHSRIRREMFGPLCADIARVQFEA